MAVPIFEGVGGRWMEENDFQKKFWIFIEPLVFLPDFEYDITKSWFSKLRLDAMGGAL